MTVRSLVEKVVQQEDLNFLLTNCLPRRWVSRLLGRFSRLEHPLVRDISIAVWKFFSDLDLTEAKETRFRSMQHCFTRQLKEGARPVDPDPANLVSPCDGILGASGSIEGGEILQIKGFSYSLEDLLGNDGYANAFREGRYATLRLTSSMYHRFHAPHDCRVELVTHIAGDAWNVNPVTLRRVKRLFCRNERAVIRTTLSATGHPIALVPVAAILVAGIRLKFLDLPSDPSKAVRTIPCDAALRKGEEMGWFEHGSTIIVLAAAGLEFCDGLEEGMTIRVGQALMRIPELKVA